MGVADERIEETYKNAYHVIMLGHVPNVLRRLRFVAQGEWTGLVLVIGVARAQCSLCTSANRFMCR